MDLFGGRGPSTWPLFDENVSENEKIGSHRGQCIKRCTCSIKKMTKGGVVVVCGGVGGAGVEVRCC